MTVLLGLAVALLVALWVALPYYLRFDVCEASKGMGSYDYHDYPDDVYGEPWHFVKLTCKRCGKGFYI